MHRYASPTYSKISQIRPLLPLHLSNVIHPIIHPISPHPFGLSPCNSRSHLPHPYRPCTSPSRPGYPSQTPQMANTSICLIHPIPPSSSIYFCNFSAISHPNRSIQVSINISHRFPIQRCDSHGLFRPPSYSRACSLMTHTFQSFPSHPLWFLDSFWSRDVAEK